ncbi:MAG: proteasome subunit beta [Thermoplasmata archaeon]
MNSNERDSVGSERGGARLSSGTTTIGLCCRDGVVLATERRATMGHFIASKEAVKLFRIDGHLGATFAGGIGDAQSVIRQLRAEAALYRLRAGRPIRVESIAVVASNLLNATRDYPLYGWFILGGVDASGPRVYSLDFSGGSIEESRYVSLGSGSAYVYGLLEETWRSGIGVNDGVDLALRGLAVAMQRDSASGDGYAIVTLTARGYAELGAAEVERRRARLGRR